MKKTTKRSSRESPLKNLDMFKVGMPGFNLDGKTTVSTICGLLVSTIIYGVTIAFGVIKLDQLLSHHSPLVNKHVLSNYLTDRDGLKLSDKPGEGDKAQFPLAFSVEDYLDEKNVMDHRFYKWIAL